MIRILISLLSLSFFLFPAFGQALPEGETLQSAASSPDSLTVVSASEQPVAPDTLTGWRKGWLGKLYRYFQNSNKDRTLTQKFDYSILGGPHYSSTTELGVGILAAGLYRLDRENLSLPPSNVTLFANVSTSGFYVVGLRGNNFFRGGRFRIDYTGYFYSMPGDFWGVGFYNGRDSTETHMERQQVKVKTDFMYQFAPAWYAGIDVDYNFTRAKSLDKLSYLPAGQHTKYINTGLGLFFQHDSRDVITNPFTGWYLKFDQIFYPHWLGNRDGFFTSTEITADYYTPLWKNAVLAFDLHGLFHAGDVPWTMLSSLGGGSRMRGYYEGRYRDKNSMEAQVELRQRIHGRIGATVWVGGGTVFPEFKALRWSHLLPTYGLGFRWEFKNRVNVRIDYGFGKDTSGLVFNINEAF
ncbi:MAG: BamA/TamA family outer membrane protein [Bacteroidaceae bacterium]|jgi:hypothetical protein